MIPQITDGTILINDSGLVVSVVCPPWWRVDRYAEWWIRKFAGWLLGRLGRKIPVWAQVGRICYDDGSKSLMVVRDTKAFVTWVPNKEGRHG